VDLIPKIAHFVILTPTGNYRVLKFKSVKNNPFWAIYACVVEARPWKERSNNDGLELCLRKRYQGVEIHEYIFYLSIGKSIYFH
jgi:hypothetical protein